MKLKESIKGKNLEISMANGQCSDSYDQIKCLIAREDAGRTERCALENTIRDMVIVNKHDEIRSDQELSYYRKETERSFVVMNDALTDRRDALSTMAAANIDKR